MRKKDCSFLVAYILRSLSFFLSRYFVKARYVVMMKDGYTKYSRCDARKFAYTHIHKNYIAIVLWKFVALRHFSKKSNTLPLNRFLIIIIISVEGV